jgi:hypothetical protein
VSDPDVATDAARLAEGLEQQGRRFTDVLTQARELGLVEPETVRVAEKAVASCVSAAAAIRANLYHLAANDRILRNLEAVLEIARRVNPSPRAKA